MEQRPGSMRRNDGERRMTRTKTTTDQQGRDMNDDNDDNDDDERGRAKTNGVSKETEASEEE